MNRKLRNAFWIVVLFIICFVGGSLMTAADNILVILLDEQQDHFILLIIGGLLLPIIIGVIGILIHVFLKDRKNTDPSYPPLVVCSVLAVCMLIPTSLRYNKTVDRMDRKWFLESFEEGLYISIEKRINDMAYDEDKPALKNHIKEKCCCVFSEIESSKALTNELMEGSYAAKFIEESPWIKNIILSCHRTMKSKKMRALFKRKLPDFDNDRNQDEVPIIANANTKETVYTSDESIFSIPVNTSLTELKNRGFILTEDKKPFNGKMWWHGTIDNKNYSAYITCIEGEPSKIVNFFLSIRSSYFTKMTKLELMSYDSVEVDHTLYRIENRTYNNTLFVNRLELDLFEFYKIKNDE